MDLNDWQQFDDSFDQDDLGQEQDDPSRTDEVLASLLFPEDGPDLAQGVLHKLGYVQVDESQTRSRRIRRWVGRATIAAVLIAGIGIGMQLYSISPQVRQAEDGTAVSDLLYHDIEKQRDQIGGAVESLRSISARWKAASEQGSGAVEDQVATPDVPMPTGQNPDDQQKSDDIDGHSNPPADASLGPIV